MRTNDLKVAIVSILSPIISQVYSRKAKKGAQYPYAVYYLEHNKMEHGYDYKLEVHIWTRDIKELEGIADQLEKLNGGVYTDETFNFDLDLNNRLNIDDEDKELQHCRLLFDLTYYHKEG